MWLIPVLLASCIAMMACAPIPYLHDATLNSTIIGKVVGSDSKLPVPGVKISIGKNTTTSDSDGNFRFLPIKETKYWKMVLIAPFDPVPPCENQIFLDPSQAGYRVEWVSVKSCRYFRVLGLNFDQENKTIIDSLGIISLLPLNDSANAK